MQKAQGPGVCKLPKPPASRALCQAKRAPRAAFPPLLIATGEVIPLRGLEGVPGLPGAPQDEAGLTRKFGEKVGLKLNIQKIKIMASGPITSWEIDGETVETVSDFIVLGSKVTADGDCSHEIKRHLLLGDRKSVV